MNSPKKYRIYDPTTECYLSYVDMSLFNVSGYTFELWTGLTDINETDIYEGDLLKRLGSALHDKGPIEVKWDQRRAGFVYNYIDRPQSYFSDEQNLEASYEIIGTIHDY